MTRSKLPPRWSLKHGAYYFQVPPDLRPMWDGKTWFRLGSTIGEDGYGFQDSLEARYGKLRRRTFP